MSTYVPIATQILSTATSSINFSGIPQTYTDLVLVCSIRDTAAGTQINPLMTFNGDSGSNYSWTRLHGNEGNQVVSGRATNQTTISIGETPGAGSTSGYFSPIIVTLPNYSNTSTNKNAIARFSNIGGAVQAGMLVGLYRSTSAITSILITAGANFASGSTFTLYGVGAGTTRATGGEIYVSSGTAYHVFRQSGVFTPLANISADILVVAGGGSGGMNTGGGGGAGGLLAFSAQSLLANTDYYVTVGAGGGALTFNGSPSGINGNNSQFGSLTAAIGGGGGGGNSGSVSGGTGGSGGGAGESTNKGLGTVGQGNDGGNSNDNAPNYGAGGGGGAGAVGSNGTSSAGGAGGAGVNTYSTWATATNTGISGFYGGSGGGGAGGLLVDAGSGTLGTSGTTNTGGGGGGAGGNNNTGPVGSGAGGSGIVIVRYTL
jgi:hypothetical protein